MQVFMQLTVEGCDEATTTLAYAAPTLATLSIAAVPSASWN